jgi:hypothetical protein
VSTTIPAPAPAPATAPPPPPPTPIALICTLDELLPYSLADTSGSRYFNLNLSVGLRTGTSLPDASVDAILQPWLLSPLALTAYADVGAAGDAPNGKAVPVTVLPNPALSAQAPSNPNPAQQPPSTAQLIQGTIGDRLSNRYAYYQTAANQDQTYYHWDDDPSNPTQNSGESWPRILAHASTYPSTIAQALNLTVAFKIAKSDLQDQHGNWLTRLWVAPTIEIDAHTTYSPKPTPETPANSFAEWNYATSPANFPLTACQPEYLLTDLTHVPDLSFIDLRTGWVATSDGTAQPTPAETIPSEDWRSTLERRVGEAFDLAQRMLVVLRAQLSTLSLTPAQIASLRDAILAALHDTADVGLRYAPDGSNLLRFVLVRAGIIAADIDAIEIALHTATSGTGVPVMNDWTTLLLNQGIAPSSLLDTPISIQTTLDLLDNLQTDLTDDDTLAGLLYAQWSAQLSTTPAWTRIPASATQTGSNTVKDTLDSLAASGLLRPRYLLANLGGRTPANNHGSYPTDSPIWTALTATAGSSGYRAESAAVQQNIANLIEAYFRGRFGLQSPDQPSTTLAALFANRAPTASWPAPLPDLAADLAKYATTFVETLFPTDVTQAVASHNVFIEVSSTAAATGRLQDDAERKIAGFGLLVREENAQWTCATVADIYAWSATPTLLVTATPVPGRLKIRNGLKQPVLEYKGGSLITEFPQDPNNLNFPNQGDTHPAANPATDPDTSQLFQYQLPQMAFADPTYTNDGTNFSLTFADFIPLGNTLADWARVPMLKYGKSYTFQPFVIANSGALPPGLGSAANPFALVLPQAFAPPVGAGYLRTITYKRRVSVGAPRWLPAVANVNMPEIPATVVPLARDCMLTPASDPTQKASADPILLLWNPNINVGRDYSSYSFVLRPPACDLDTWDRSIAGLTESAADQQAGKTYRSTRLAVATAFNRFSPKSVLTDPTQPVNDPNQPDLSLDDPFVQSIEFTLTPVYSTSTATTPAAQKWSASSQASPTTFNGDATSPKSMAKVLLGAVQFSGITVNCSIQDAAGHPIPPGAPILTLAGTTLTVAIPEGEVWQLTATPQLITNPQASDVFDPAPVVGLFTLLIEAPQAGIFAPHSDTKAFAAALWVNLAVQPAASGNVLTGLNVTLTPWSIGKQDPTQRDLIRGISLSRQVWRWTGRPVAPYPFDWPSFTLTAGDPAIDADPAITNNIPNSRTWEVGSFVERPDSDAIVAELSVNFAAPVPVPVQLYALDLTHDLRAQYYRFTIDAHSRYQGLPGLALSTVRAEITGSLTDSTGTSRSWFTNWKRQVIPPRVSGKIPKPKISLVLPLTIPNEIAKSTLPDLLVIANEPWFQTGGLAEELCAHVSLAREPSIPLVVPIANANPLPEIGPNPLLSSATFATPVAQPSANQLAAEPIGSTFDLNTTAPLFGNTCFRLSASALNALIPATDPPKSFPLPSTNLEHNLVKLSFIRRINNRLIGPSADDLISDPTEAVWVEFQPSFAHCNTKNNGLIPIGDSLRFSISAGALLFTAGDQAVSPISGPPAGAPLELWALIMQSISDVKGSNQQKPSSGQAPVKDQFVACDLIALNGTTPTSDSPDLVVYLLEVLCVADARGKFTSGFSSARDMLFPPAGSSPEAQARIQRCSAVIRNVAWKATF